MPRNILILFYYWSGATYDSIAQQFGFSRQRAHQIVLATKTLLERLQEASQNPYWLPAIRVASTVRRMQQKPTTTWESFRQTQQDLRSPAAHAVFSQLQTLPPTTSDAALLERAFSLYGLPTQYLEQYDKLAYSLYPRD